MLDNDNTLWRALTHPVTALSGLAAMAGHFLQVPVLSAAVSTAWAHAGMLFAGVSLGSGRLGQTLGIPSAAVNGLILVAGMLWLAKIFDRLWDGFSARLNRSDTQ